MIHSVRVSIVGPFAMACHPCTSEYVALVYRWHDTATLRHFPSAMFDWPDRFVWLAVVYRQRMSLEEMHVSSPNRPHSMLSTRNSQHLPFARHEFVMCLDLSHECDRTNCPETWAFVNLLWSRRQTAVDCPMHDNQTMPHHSYRFSVLVASPRNLAELWIVNKKNKRNKSCGIEFGRR